MPPLLAASTVWAAILADHVTGHLDHEVRMAIVVASYCRGVRMLAGGAGSKSLRNGLMSMPPRRMKRA